MTTMLYFWREGKAIGTDLRFLYNGHELEDERIERASKRRKISFPPPTCEWPKIDEPEHKMTGNTKRACSNPVLYQSLYLAAFQPSIASQCYLDPSKFGCGRHFGALSGLNSRLGCGFSSWSGLS
jgi:hypothetical protein